MNYGLTNQLYLKECIDIVCNCLGYGINGVADELLIETARAETGAGTIADNSIGAGMGITQIDKIPFVDIQDRVRHSDRDKIKEELGIDLALISWEHIRYNPLLCVLFTRLKYKKIPETIPSSIKGRAEYWKTYYNTEAGKGTVKHYIDANKKG